MEKMAALAQIVFAFALVVLNSIAIVLLCNWYNKHKSDSNMQETVNAEVA